MNADQIPTVNSIRDAFGRVTSDMGIPADFVHEGRREGYYGDFARFTMDLPDGTILVVTNDDLTIVIRTEQVNGVELSLIRVDHAPAPVLDAILSAIINESLND